MPDSRLGTECSGTVESISASRVSARAGPVELGPRAKAAEGCLHLFPHGPQPNRCGIRTWYHCDHGGTNVKFPRMSYLAVSVDRANPSVGEMCHHDSRHFRIHLELFYPKGTTLDKAMVKILGSHGVGMLTGVSQDDVQITPLLGGGLRGSSLFPSLGRPCQGCHLTGQQALTKCISC